MSVSIHTIERKPRTENAGPAPLLIMLHGYGSNEHDLFDLAQYLDPRLHIVSARGVLSLPWGGFAWYNLGGTPGNLRPDPDTRERAVGFLENFIRDLPGRLGTDPQRTFLLGFSQGAIMSLAMAMRLPERLAGVIALSGYLDPDLNIVPPPAGLAELDILQIHGLYDDVIPIDAARRSRELFEATPARYTYSEDPIGHSISLEGLQLIREWLDERLAEKD